MIGRNRLLRFGGPGAPLVCGALYLGLMMNSVVWAQQSDWRGSAEDRVPAQGEPPLTQVAVDRLIGFFEWALDIRFTRAERADAMAPLARSFHFSTAENPARAVFTEREHVIVVSGARVVSVIPAFFIGGGGTR